jgi:hypothetical protein
MKGADLHRLHGDEFHLAELGQLLRTDVEHSLRPLALLYGGLFYQSFGRLTHCVRTGQDAFELQFGQHNFDYIVGGLLLASAISALLLYRDRP